MRRRPTGHPSPEPEGSLPTLALSLPALMFRTVQPVVWAFDCEWVPCARSGRLLLDLGRDVPEADVFAALWEAAGATVERPRPFLPLAWSRVASVAVVERRVRPDGSVALALCSAPADPDAGEADVLRPFLRGLARRRPQLVGYNSHASDLPVLRQRALALGLDAPGLCARPERPWDGPDYGHPYNEWNVDLLRALGGRRGPTSPRLADLAALCGIPAKSAGGLAVTGADVADLWLTGDRDAIRRYNEGDALTTYLLWLRTARLAGLFSAEGHAAEEGRLEQLLEREVDARGAEAGHLGAFLERWRTASADPLRGPLDPPDGIALADTAVR